MTEKRLRVAVVMDPIEDIKPAKDTTLAMMLAAQRRGWELAYLELGHLWLRDGVALGRAHPVEVRDDLGDWHSRGEATVRRLGDFDVILMRKDPPFDTEYIYATYILERAEMQGALVVNGPQGLRDMNEKVFTAWFPECCAPTLITRDMADMARLLALYPYSVWINPQPGDYWSYIPSIAMVKQLFSDRMFPLTIDGLERAMKTLSK